MSSNFELSSGVIGIAGTAFTIVTWLIAQFTREPDNQYAVQMQVAQSNGEISGEDGWIPQMQHYDYNGNQFLSSGYSDWWVNSGSLGKRSYGNGLTQSTYRLGMLVGDNAICMVHVSQQDPDGSIVAITGDYLKACGVSYYPSQIYTIGGEDGGYAYCAWMGNGNNGCLSYAWEGLSFERGPMTANSLQNGGRVLGCEALQPWNGPCSSKRGMSAADNGALPLLSDTITITKRASAEELCNAENSLGPSMVSLQEGLFCDMRTKTLSKIRSDITARAPVNASGLIDINDILKSFKPAPMSLDVTTPAITKRSHSDKHRRDVEINQYDLGRVEGENVYDCTTCCKDVRGFGTSYNETHHVGHNSDLWYKYDNVTSGIVISEPNGTVFIADCRTTILTSKVVVQKNGSIKLSKTKQSVLLSLLGVVMMYII